MQSQSQLTKYVYAPENTSFTHTSPKRFTYFSGSHTGVRSTFGLSCEKLAALVQNYVTQTKLTLRGDSTQLSDALTNLNDQIQTLLAKMQNNYLYSSSYEIAEGIVNSGHIPLILSSITAAAQYERSARSLSASNVQFYLDAAPGSSTQAKEFLVKQDMMKAIAAFRNTLNQQRYALNQYDYFLYEYNKVIQSLDEEIIKENLKSLPKDCEQFDLSATFFKKAYELVSSFSDKIKNPKQELLTFLKNYTTGYYGATPFIIQRLLSNALYEKLASFIETNIGISKDTQEFEFTDEQDDMLQNVLPLLAYLNSEYNPFARNGLFGKPVESTFHTEALNAYESHEKKAGVSLVIPNTKTSPNPNTIEYDGNQIERLLFGIETVIKQQEAGIFGFFQGLLTEGSASDRNQPSDSERRRSALTLPTPAQYLMLEAAPSPSTPSPSPSNRQ